LDEVREIGERITLYSQLRYIALEEGRKLGWAAHFYRSLHGDWPKREWTEVPPMRPTVELSLLVERRQRSFRQAMKQRDDERRAADERARGLENGEVADAVQQGEEGAVGVSLGGRVHGMEEQDERPGELCPADE
jgi:hypothetical protein